MATTCRTARFGSGALRAYPGFTLIEVMTVVTILGLLAVVAVGAFTRYVRNAKKSEVTANIAQISLRQRSHLATGGHYASSTTCEGVACTYPTATDITLAGGVDLVWDITSDGYSSNSMVDSQFMRGGGNLHGFDALRFMPEGGTSLCGYATLSGHGTNAMVPDHADEPPDDLLANQIFPPDNAALFARDWFYSYALCDFDSDGTYWAFTSAHYTSDVNAGSDDTQTYLENE